MDIRVCKDIFGALPSGADIVVFTSGETDADSRGALARAACGGSADGAAVGALVLRTSARELSFYCEPVTLETDAAHNFAFAITQAALNAVGAPDKRFGCAAATDFIRRINKEGFKTVYVPDAVTRGEFEKESLAERIYGALALAMRYGRFSDIMRAKICWLKAFKSPEGYRTTRKELFASLRGRFGALCSLFFARLGSGKKYKGEYSDKYAPSLGFERGDYTSPKAQSAPRVSLITRTRNRPETLRKTLESLRHQTYANIEPVVIEDGEPLSEQMIRRDFADLGVTYKATVENVGRSAAANLGFELARGEWLGLLDDDDYLLPEHVELAVSKALAEGADIVFLRGVALEIEKTSADPYRFEVRSMRELDFPRVDAFTMARRCVTTQNGVLFKKSLYEQTGGMRTEMGAHEDWNLWLRLMTKGKSVTLPYVTCCYIVPADREAERERLAKYAKHDAELLDDERLVYTLSAAELREAYESVINDYAYLFSLDIALEHLAGEYAKAKAFLENRGENTARFDRLLDGETHTLTGYGLRELYDNLIVDFENMRAKGALKRFIANELGEINS